MSPQGNGLVARLGSPDSDGNLKSLVAVWEELESLSREDQSLPVDSIFGAVCEAQGRLTQIERIPDTRPEIRFHSAQAPPYFTHRVPVQYPSYQSEIIQSGHPPTSKEQFWGTPQHDSSYYSGKKPYWRNVLNFIKQYKCIEKSETCVVVIPLMELHVPCSRKGKGAVKLELTHGARTSTCLGFKLFGSELSGGIRVAMAGGTRFSFVDCGKMCCEIEMRTVTYENKVTKKKKHVMEPTRVIRELFYSKLSDQDDRCRAGLLLPPFLERNHPIARWWYPDANDGGITGPRECWGNVAEEKSLTVNLGAEFSHASLELSFEKNVFNSRAIEWTFPDGSTNIPVVKRKTEELVSGLLPYFVRVEG